MFSDGSEMPVGSHKRDVSHNYLAVSYPRRFLDTPKSIGDSDVASGNPGDVVKKAVSSTEMHLTRFVTIETDDEEKIDSYEKRNKVPFDSSGVTEVSATASPVVAIRSILVVDDSVTSRKVLLRSLRTQGTSIFEAVDGLDAVSQLRSRMESGEPAFDVILMDNMMPNMDGPTATRAMRDMGYEGLIIGMTAEESMKRCRGAFVASGVDIVLSKPLQFGSFEKTVKGKNNYLSFFKI